MKVTPTAIADVLIIEPKVFGDERGFFYESFNAKKFAELTGVETNFVQDNHSMSAKNVLRGMHYQIQQAQGKLVRVISGEVFDVAVDLRKSSPRFGQWTGVTLSAANPLALVATITATSRFLTVMDIGDLSVIGNFPALNRIEVIDRSEWSIQSAHSDQLPNSRL